MTIDRYKIKAGFDEGQPFVEIVDNFGLHVIQVELTAWLEMAVGVYHIGTATTPTGETIVFATGPSIGSKHRECWNTHLEPAQAWCLPDRQAE